ncbi:hypothetical protein ACFL1Z_02150 [Thermodesulfobacteriota bacterium]
MKSPEGSDEVDIIKGVRVENIKDFGGPWLYLELIRQLNLNQFFEEHLPKGREHILWSTADLLVIPSKTINEDRLYRALDKILSKKADLETHVKERMDSLFKLDYDLFLYGVTSTYFEGRPRSIPYFGLFFSLCFMENFRWSVQSSRPWG